MKNIELIDLAIKKVGGLRELSRQIGWNHGSIAQAKRDGKIPPHIAVELAEIVETSTVEAWLEASRSQKITEKERAILGKLLKIFKA